MKNINIEFTELPRDEFERLPYYPSNHFFLVLDNKVTSQGVFRSITIYKGKIPVAFEDVLSLIPENIKMRNGGFRAMAFAKGVDAPEKPKESDFPFYKDLVNSQGTWQARPIGELNDEIQEVWWASFHWFNGDKTNTLDSGDAWTEPIRFSGVRGNPFLYDDFTEEQINGLMKPATDAALELEKKSKEWDSQEKNRIDKESIRESNESVRQSAEQGRVAAENRRVENENQRVASEQGRVTAEQGRAKAESERQSNEEERKSGENGRKEAETARKEAEKKRASDEEARQGNETARQDAEGKREEAERARARSEAERVTAETKRSKAESARKQAESGRVSAEQQRVSAEQQRVSAFATLKQESLKATEAANEAADNANGAAALANLNTLAVVFNDTTGKLDAVTGADGSAFTKGEITPQGNVVLTFDY